MTMDPAMALEVQALGRQRSVDMAMESGLSECQQFYKDTSIFITGGSGFVGKHLVEKLLRSCDIKRIYLLMRGKKGQSAQERLGKIFQDPLFEPLHKRKPDFAKRVTAINGDITQLRLGISDQDWQMLTDEVNVIFHVAATVTFDEPLRVATLTNVRGTTQALLLGKDCKRLMSYVHVSTAYAHVTHGRIGGEVMEQFYDSPIEPATLIDLVEQLSEEKLAAIKPKLIEDWPNTYAFTKAVAEEAVRTMAGDLPVCILRPAIVIASYLEPTPGWLDFSNVYGPSGLFLGCGLGVMHTFMADNDSYIDLIPVDLVNNATMAAGFATAKRHEKGHRDIKIYTVAPARNPIKWRDLINIMYEKASKISTPKALWYTFDYHTRHRALFVILTWLLHFIPGYLADGMLVLLGKKPRVMKLYGTALNLSTALSFYTCHEFYFNDINLQNLYNSLTPTDKHIYNFDIKSLDWVEMLLLWGIGLRKYIIKDGLKDTEYAVKKQLFFRVLNIVVLVLYAYVLYKVFSMTVSFVSMLC